MHLADPVGRPRLWIPRMASTAGSKSVCLGHPTPPEEGSICTCHLMQLKSPGMPTTTLARSPRIRTLSKVLQGILHLPPAPL